MTFSRTHSGSSVALLLALSLNGCGQAEPQDLIDEASVQAKSSALLTPKVTEIVGMAVPGVLLDRPREAIIRTAADANTLLGSVPAGVDFTKEFLVFYAAGVQPTLGYTTSLSFDRIYINKTALGASYRYQLVVSGSTVLDPPGSGCPGEQPGIGRPFTLVRVDATGLRDFDKVNSQSLMLRNTTIVRTCHAPGPECDGTLTAAGLAAISTRPSTGGSVPLYTTGRSYATNYLGRYTIARWKEECVAGSCSWRQIIPDSSDYLRTGSLYHYAGGGESRLVIFSSEGSDTFYSGGGRTYPCWLWGEALYNTIDARTGRGALSGVSIKDNMTCLVASGANYRNKNVGLNGFEGAMGDRCVRLTSQTGRPGIDSVLQVLTAQW